LNYWILFGARWTPDALELKDPAAHACTAVATAGRLTSPISALCGSEQYLLDAPRSHACSCAMPLPRGYPARPPHGVHGIARVVPMGACTYILYTKQCFMGEKSMHNN
jgi:hypothetical protein